MQMVLIDHYDSFSFNVIDWLAAGDPPLSVRYLAADDAAGLTALIANPEPVVLSPGPKRPEDAPLTMALARALLGRAPILGICFGHQVLAHLAGLTVARAVDPHHGTTRRIYPTATPGILSGMPNGFAAATYNSLVAVPGALAPGWNVSAHCERSEIQALTFEVPGRAPAFGVQFHPESFLSEGAAMLRANWLAALRAPLPSADHGEL